LTTLVAQMMALVKALRPETEVPARKPEAIPESTAR
jgi:hypothetical protein